MFLSSIKLNDRTTRLKWFNNLVSEVASKDEPTIFTELFNKDIKEVDVAGERLSPDLLKDQRDAGAMEASTGR